MTLVGGYHEATGWLHNQSLLLSRSSVHSISNMEQEGSTYECKYENNLLITSDTLLLFIHPFVAAVLAGITYCAPCQ